MDDLGPNKKYLAEVASAALYEDVLVDLGVRTGTSSRVMLDASKGMVIGVDLSTPPDISDKRYSFLQADSITASMMMPPSLYLVFFDTLHVKEQVMAELFHYWPKIRVSGWAVFHDTNWPEGKKDHYLGQDWEQPIEGIKAFFGTTDQVETIHYLESWGMTFIKKLSDWNPIVPGMREAIQCSQRLTEMLK